MRDSSGTRGRLLKRFRTKEYRHSYVESFLNSVISAQIRILREREGWSQKELADKIGTQQSGISRYENPDYSSWRIETLRKLARAFDMALSVRFVSFGDSIDEVEGFGSDRLIRPAFAEDPAFDPDEATSQSPRSARVIDFPGAIPIPRISSSSADECATG